MEDNRLVLKLLVQPMPLGPPSTRMVSPAALKFYVLFPAPRSLSQLLSHSWLFFIWAVGMCGKGKVFFPTSGPHCLHVVNYTSPSPIKQASQAWLCVAVSLMNLLATRFKRLPHRGHSPDWEGC